MLHLSHTKEEEIVRHRKRVNKGEVLVELSMKFFGIISGIAVLFLASMAVTAVLVAL